MNLKGTATRTGCIIGEMRLITLLAACALALPAAESIAGKWNFVYETPVGKRESPTDISVEGDKVTAVSAGRKFTGTCKDGKFKIAGEVGSAEHNRTGELTLEGTVSGDKISGQASFAGVGFPFSATKAK